MMIRGLLIAPFVVMCSCSASKDSCANTVIRESIAPGNRTRAVVIVRDCGATTPLSAQVAVVPFGDPVPNTAANAFIPDHRYGGDQADSAVQKISTTWLSDSVLVIRHPWGSHFFRAEPRVATIRIRYEEPTLPAPNEEL